mgnify:CR=1 FL=1
MEKHQVGWKDYHILKQNPDRKKLLHILKQKMGGNTYQHFRKKHKLIER